MTGSLKLLLIEESEQITRRLLDLHISFRFRRLDIKWWVKEDRPGITRVIGACSETLECLYFVDATLSKLCSLGFCHVGPVPNLKPVPVPGYSWAASIDLSKATNLKEVTFCIEEFSIAWVTATLKTIKSEHRGLQEVSIKGYAFSDSVFWSTDAASVGDKTRDQWMELDYVLAQLWESHAVRTKISFHSERGEETCEFVGGLLPETTRRGIGIVYLPNMY